MCQRGARDEAQRREQHERDGESPRGHRHQRYQITGDLTANNNAKIVPHMSHKMQLTGEVTEKDGKMMIAATDLKMLGK